MQSELVIAGALAVCMFIFYSRKPSSKPKFRQFGKTVIVGGSSGIGAELARQIHEEKVIVGTSLERLEKSIKDSKNCHLFQGDITNQEDMEKLVKFSIQKMGRVDTLILSAGVLSVMPFEKMENRSMVIDKIISVNTTGPIKTTGLFLDELLKTNGQIIVISSASGVIPAPTRSLYTASKHALTGFVRSLRIEVENRIHICHVMPGSVDTPLRNSSVDAEQATRVGIMQKQVPGQRSKAMSPQACAYQIIQAAKILQDEVYIPSWYQYVVTLYTLFPSLIDRFTRAKYSYPPK